MATRNTRALTLKANAQELENKLSDIKRLLGALKKFVLEVLSSASLNYDTIEATAEIGNLEVRARYYRANRDARLELWRDEERITADHQFDIRTVRLVHDNLDVFIELSESICEDAGRLEQFRAKLVRFED